MMLPLEPPLHVVAYGRPTALLAFYAIPNIIYHFGKRDSGAHDPDFAPKLPGMTSTEEDNKWLPHRYFPQYVL